MMLHLHDYEMKFTGEKGGPISGDPLDYTLICRCGDIAPDKVEALRRMHNSRILDMIATMVVIILASMVLGQVIEKVIALMNENRALT